MSFDCFIKKLANETGAMLFMALEGWEDQEKEAFYEDFKPFLSSMLNYLQKYLPLADPIIESLDFVRLLGSYEQLSSKIHHFNKHFKITNPEHLTTELARLQSEGFDIYRDLTSNTLKLWDKIENNGYIHLPQVAKVAHILPTSSADVEQTFSDMKLFKNLLRNRLNEASLEALLLVDEELRIKKYLPISENMLNSFDLVMENQNKRSYSAISQENPRLWPKGLKLKKKNLNLNLRKYRVFQTSQ